MIGLAFKLPAEGPPGSGSRRVLDVDVTPQRASDVAEAFRDLIGRIPEHPAILPLIDAGVLDGRPFYVTAPADGESLDLALERYGPAAVDDALPRLRQIAHALDRAAQHGFCHGALQPRDIVISADDTQLAGVGVADALEALGITPSLNTRYAAPEVLTGEGGSAAADQFSLAIIAYEWMFGASASPAPRLVVPPMADVDVAAMQRAFDMATSADPASRFSSCTEFVRGLRSSPVNDIVAPLHPGELPLDDELRLRDASEPPVDAAALEAFTEEPTVTTSAANRYKGDGAFSETYSGIERPAVRPSESPGDDAPALSAPSDTKRYGVAALAGALLTGVVLGAAGMWLLNGPATLSSSSSGDGQSRDFTEAAVVSPQQAATAAPGPTEVVDTPITPPRDDVPVARGAPESPPRSTNAVPAAKADARLLVHSVPAGATVTIDGRPRGTTPVAVRGLELKTHQVLVSRPGYQPVERQVALTSERPSRTLEVELTPTGRATPTPAPTSAGTLVVDSRPAGATVTVDGRPAGVTPLTLTGIAPGRHRVQIEHAGYRTVTTTVEVKPGERARVAARLEGGMDEE